MAKPALAMLQRAFQAWNLSNVPLVQRGLCGAGCELTRSTACSSIAKSLMQQISGFKSSSYVTTDHSHQPELDEINDLFSQARDEIQFAQGDAGTTYFNESYDDAKSMVDDCISKFNNLLSRLSDEEKGKVQRAMGLKMEQLKAELSVLDELHD